MENAATAALQEFRAAIRDLERNNTPIDVARFGANFRALGPNELATLQQRVVVELRELLGLIAHPIYRGVAEHSCAETFVFFTRLYDWGRDDRAIADTLITEIHQRAELNYFKAYVRSAMAKVSPDEYQDLFGQDNSGSIRAA